MPHNRTFTYDTFQFGWVRLGRATTFSSVATVRGKSGEKETQQADDVHPNNMTDRFEVIGHVPALMATWLSKHGF